MISKVLLTVAIIAALLLLSTNADIHLQTQLPRQAEGSIKVSFRGSLTMLSAFAETDAKSTLVFNNVKDEQQSEDVHPPVLQTAQITFFAYNKDVRPVSNLLLFTTHLTADEQLNIQDLLNKSPYQFKKDELIYFTGHLDFAPTTDKIDAEHLAQYQALMSYSANTKTLTQSLKSVSSHKGAAGLWVDTVRTDPQATFYAHKAGAKRDFLSILLKNLPFSTSKVSFFASDHLILTKQKDKIFCSINGLESIVTIDAANQRFDIELNPETDFAVLYETDFNLQCEDIIFVPLSIGDNTNTLYLEFIDRLYNEPSGLEVQLRTHSLPNHYPIIDAEIITGTLPTPTTHSAIVCSYDVFVDDPALTLKGLHDGIFKITLQNVPMEPSEAFVVLSASYSAEHYYDTRIPLFKAQLKADSDTNHSTFSTTLTFNETNWNNPKVVQSHAMLLTYTFVFPKGETPSPLVPIMPQCALTFTEKESKISMYQIMMNTVGQPLSPTPVEFSSTSVSTHGKHNVDFSLGKINGGFNHFVLDLPQEDAYFSGDFKCKLTEVSYPDGDETKTAETKTYDLARVDFRGAVYNATTRTTEVIFHHESLLGGAKYSIKCPESYITPMLEENNRFSSVSYNATLMYIYAYENDSGSIYTPRYYLAGSNYIQFTGTGAKSHKLIWAAIFTVLIIGFCLAVFAVYVRSKKSKAAAAGADEDDHGFFQQLQDPSAGGSTDYH